ncbi:hypothetical protein ACEWY4_016846 [Coilia grayii]|uniref:Ig-like domain-containing protein n=1 Tax=Coilia grayii TaxID=363190 RepID=A0ABD1JLJ8_9TELE
MNNLIRIVSTIFLMFGVSQGRLVMTPQGPLLRVEGQPVALPCSVTDYEGPSEQDFDWLVVDDTNPIQVISTFDALYTNSGLKERVANGDIRIERLGDNKVELRIREIKMADSGVYRCTTPSTDTQVVGDYFADVKVRVIPDSLILEPRTPVAIIPEGGSVGLFCNATWNHTQGTYLSVTWSARKGTSTLEDLLTYGPDGDVLVTDAAAQRYTSGGLRLDLQHRGSYGLVLSGARPTDEGVYVCTAREWAKEPGGSWYKLQQKRMDFGHVSVTPTAQSLNVSLQGSTTLTTGDTLTLSCLVKADDYSSLGLDVWLTGDSRDLAHMDRNGVLADISGTDPTTTTKAAGLRRISEGEFRLDVPAVETSDSGLYSCHIRAWMRNAAQGWYHVAEATSNRVEVLVTHLETSFSVAFSALVTPRLPGDPTELECRVTNVTHLRNSRFAVSWHHRPTSAHPVTAAPSSFMVGSLDYNGAMQPGPRHRRRLDAGLVTMTHEEPLTFKLRLLHTGESDVGEYTCSVSTWSLSRSGRWEAGVDYQTPAFKVAFTTKGPSLSVVARRVREVTASGATFEMSCQVMAENLRSPAYSVLIHSQAEVGGTPRRLVSLSPEAVMRVEDWSEPGRQDSVVLLRTGPNEFSFRLQGVQVSDRGFYSCEVSAWTKQPGETDWSKVVHGVSNKIQISYEHKGPSFGVSISSDTTSLYPWETAKMECTMSVSGTPPNPDDMVFEVRWYLTRLRGSNSPVLLATMDRHGLVRKSPRNDSSDVSLERSGPRSITLSVHSTQDSDTGEYHCTATPWMRSLTTGSWSQAPALTSTRVFLNVKFALWDSMRLPLLYGVCAAAVMGVVSLLLGLICTRCCCRNTAYTPRPRTKLMELEMD